MTSIERRFARFLANERLVVPVICKLFLAPVLAPFRGQKLYFVLDKTPFQDNLTIVYLGLLVHSRVLPVAWEVMPAKTTWEEGQWEIVGRLLDQVCLHLPDTSCTLIADRGLSGMALVKLCQKRGWHYLLRVCQEQTCRRSFKGKLEKSWKRFEQIVLKPGFRWYGQARVWQEETLETFVSLVWDKGCEEAWLLISDQGAGHETAFRNMRGACAWKPPFKTARAAASTLKRVGSKTGDTWSACCWCSLWQFGGPRIWQLPVFIMGSDLALIE